MKVNEQDVKCPIVLSLAWEYYLKYRDISLESDYRLQKKAIEEASKFIKVFNKEFYTCTSKEPTWD